MIATILGWLGISRTLGIVLEIAAVLAIGAGVAWWIHSLRDDSHAYKALKSEVVAIETKYFCKDRQAAAGQLTTCLTERDNQIEAAKNEALNNILSSALRANDELNKMNQQVFSTQAAMDKFVQASPAFDDGPLPAVVTKYWERVRSGRAK